MATAVLTPATGDPLLKALLGPAKWQSGALTYSFPTDTSLWGSPLYGGSEGQPGYLGAYEASPFSATQQSAALRAFASVATAAAVTFTYDASHKGTIRWGNINNETRTFKVATEDPNDRSPGDIWFSKNGPDAALLADPRLGTYGGFIALHELGHALGLKHPFGDPVAANNLPAEWDSQEFTVMTYRSFVGADPAATRNEASGYAQSLMMLDIRALQELYGANFGAGANNTDTAYRWNPSTGEMSIDGNSQGAPAANRIFLTVWDGGGTDTYDLSDYTTGVTVNLNPGEWSTTATGQLVDLNAVEPGNTKWARGNIANALLFNGDLRSIIENAVGGAGNDVFHGNAVNNVLTGNAGTDRFFYLGGVDVFNGGADTDTADFSKLDRPVWVDLAYPGLEAWTRGATLSSGAWAAIADLNDVENVTGTAFDDDLVGNAGNNRLEGGAGSDLFRYSGGADTFIGGDGTNTLDLSRLGGTGVVVNLLVTTIRSADGLTDYGTVQGVQNVLGTAAADTVHGNQFNNQLNGGDGDDRLMYAGGRDILDGDAGSDVADFSSLAGPVWIDLAFAGDEAWTRGNDLDNPANIWTPIADLVEIERVAGSHFNDYLRGSSTTTVLSANDGDDRLVFNATFVTLDGGNGSDTAEFAFLVQGLWVDLAYAGYEAWMRFGSSDIYVVIANLDLIENVVGSAFADTIAGDANANTLDGRLGNDEIRGRGGNDTLRWSGGFDLLDGGTETDTADFSQAPRGVWVNLTYAGVEAWMNPGPGPNEGGFTTQIADLVGIENLVGTAFNDVLFGDGQSNVLTWTGGFDSIDGMGGTDTADFSRSAKGVWVNLGYAGVEAWTRSGPGPNDGGYNTAIADLAGIENLTGSAFNDVLIGDTGANTISWTGGFDVIDGSLGVDRADFSQSSRGVWVSLSYAGPEAWMRTGPGPNDGAYNSAIADLAGIESITGSGFDDFLVGSQGVANLIAGGAGNDLIGSHVDGDTLTGGGGTDTFFFFQYAGLNPSATIADFNAAAGDRIDLSRIDADTSSGGDQAFLYDPLASSFDGTKGRLILQGGILRGDTNGDGVADFSISISALVPPEALIL